MSELTELDIDYFLKIVAYIKKEENRHTKKYIHELTTTPKKFIDHVKHYIDHRLPEYPDVTFSDDYSYLRIY